MADLGIVSALVGGALVILLIRLAAVERRLNRLSRLEAKLDARLRASGVAFDPAADIPASVRQALDEGETILAIKRLREATGVGLRDAKLMVDEMRRRRDVTS